MAKNLHRLSQLARTCIVAFIAFAPGGIPLFVLYKVLSQSPVWCRSMAKNLRHQSSLRPRTFTAAIIVFTVALINVFQSFSTYLPPQKTENVASIVVTHPASYGGTTQQHRKIETSTDPSSIWKRESIGAAPQCSQLSLLPHNINFTLVTQCDENRVLLAATQCTRWKGPLSLAVLTNRTSHDIIETLVNAGRGCKREQIMVHTVPPDNFVMKEYPANHLRNLAVRGVQTSHLVHLDVDFLPSVNLETTLQDDLVRKSLAEDYKHALVIPNFQYKPVCGRTKGKNNCTDEELLQRMPQSKDDLMQLETQGEAFIAHGSTNYTHWKHEEGEETILLNVIPCLDSHHYEPYLVVQNCREMPPHQEPFTAHGFDQASWVAHLRSSDYRFSQISGVFCTHFPHRLVSTVARKKSIGDEQSKIQILARDFLNWLEQEYKNPVRTPCCGGQCKSKY
jgi:hypothetical protein